MARTVGIGIQDFEKARRQNIFLVDKTRFIKDWWEEKDDVTLITRPRRFGKTLTLSMVEQFFSINYQKTDIFRGMDIWKYEQYQELQGTYPVISLSFSDVKGETYEMAREGLTQIIVDLYGKFSFLLNGDTLTRYWEKLTSFIQRLFNSTFKTNPYMERGLMTGITRVSKESIFSGLNNLVVVTTTSRKYADKFGFTEAEVDGALEEYGILKRKSEVKRWYNGFRFGEQADIYNPWSIINYLDNQMVGPYWANTSSNSLAANLIQKGTKQVKETFGQLLAGETITTEFDEQIVYHQLDLDESAIWSLLLASGYLKVCNTRVHEAAYGDWQQTFTLAITNFETKVMFRNMVRDWFAAAASNYNEFIQALLSDNVKEMNIYMNRVALATFSFLTTVIILLRVNLRGFIMVSCLGLWLSWKIVTRLLPTVPKCK